MQARTSIRGVVAAIATPVDAAFQPNARALVAHARWLFEHGCDGLNVLGTTGGFASFSVAQRIGVMRALAESGLSLDAMMVGAGASALDDAVELTKTAVALGYGGTLLIPPFYYKNVTEDGIFAYVATLIERVGAPDLRLYLYNFPAMSAVPYTVALVERLITAYPRTIVGLKDSANDAAYCAALHRAFPEFAIFPSSESALTTARRAGYAGCISATVNLTAPLAGSIWHSADDAQTDARQTELAAIRDAIGRFPLIPAVHHLLDDLHGDATWSNVAPPLRPLTADERAELTALCGELLLRRERPGIPGR